MVKKLNHHLDSSSDDDDLCMIRRDLIVGARVTTSPNPSPSSPSPHVNTATFALQVPATYANKHPALVDRNGLVSSSLSEKQKATNSHRVPQQKEETWKRPDLMESRFQGPRATTEAKIFGNPSAVFGDFAPSCANPRVALPPVHHKFRLATVTNTNNNNTVMSNSNNSNKNILGHNNLIPALVFPQHNAQQLLEKDFHLILEANKNNNNNMLSSNKSTSRNVSRLSGAKIETARTLPSITSIATSFNNSNSNDNNNNEKKLLSQTARSRPPPPPFTSVKMDDANSNAALSSYLDDKDAEEKMNALKSSNGKILFRQQQQQLSASSPNSSRATSKLSEGGPRQTSNASSHVSSSCNNSTSSSRRNNNAGNHKKVVASAVTHDFNQPPDENDYIEDSTEDPEKFRTNQEWTKHALDQFDYQTLPPVIEAARRQQEALGRNALALQMSAAEASFNGSMNNGGARRTGAGLTSAAMNGALKSAPHHVDDSNIPLAEDVSFAVPAEFASQANSNVNNNNNNNNNQRSPHQSPILMVNANNNGSTTEAASARVARTLFHAGLCQNLQTIEKLKTKITPQDLEKRLQSDFLHRRQVSKEDLVAFLARVLKEEHVNRREADLIWTMLDSNGNGVLETRELRSELVKFVKTGIRDISFSFVAQLLEGRETTACNAFISRFDIQNIVSAITTFYKEDKDVCDAVKDLPDKFQYNHHLARIPIAVLRDRILGDRKVLSIFQAVALEARKLKLEENAAKGIPFASALAHFAPMSIPQHYNNGSTNEKRVGSTSTNNNNNNNNNNANDLLLGNTVGGFSDTVMSATLSDKETTKRIASGVTKDPSSPGRRKSTTDFNNNNNPILTNYSHPTTTMMIRSSANLNSNHSNNNSNNLNNTNSGFTNNNNNHNASVDLNAVYLVGPGSEHFVDHTTGELLGSQKRRVSKQHNLGGGSLQVMENKHNNNTNASGHVPNHNSTNNSNHSSGTTHMNNNSKDNTHIVMSSSSRRSSVQSNEKMMGVGVHNGKNTTTTTSAHVGGNKKPLRRKPSNISQQLAHFEHNSNASLTSPALQKALSFSNSNNNIINGPESSSAAGIVRMIHNPITSADRHVCHDAKKQNEATESGNPRWYTKANVLYVETSDTRQARPVFQSTAV